MDYEGNFPEQDSAVSVLKNPMVDRPLVFKQFIKEGPFLADNGWKIIDHHLSWDSSPEQWKQGIQLVNEEGAVLDQDGVFFDLVDRHPWIEVFTYQQRTGRYGAFLTDIKLCPEHFPKGTIFEINERHAANVVISSDGSTLKQRTFEVFGIERIGVRSYVIETTARVRGIFDKTKLEPFIINIGHVERIIKRGKGPLVIDHGARKVDWKTYNARSLELLKEETGDTYPAPRKGEMVFFSVEMAIRAALIEVGQMNDFADIKFSAAIPRQFFRHHALTLYSAAPWVSGADICYVKFNALTTWMRKNHHRLMVKRDVLERQEEELDRRECERNYLD